VDRRGAERERQRHDAADFGVVYFDDALAGERNGGSLDASPARR